MFKLRRLLAVLILVAVVLLGFVIWRHLQRQNPLEVLEALPEQIDVSLDQVHYTQNEDGQRSWTLDADKAEYSRDAGQAQLEAVRLVLYRAGQFGETTLNAEHGLFEEQQQLVEVWGNVRIETARGDWIRTERLRYDGEQQQITTAEPVQISNSRMEMTGTGMMIDLPSNRMRLEKDVWMLLLPDKGKSGNEN